MIVSLNHAAFLALSAGPLGWMFALSVIALATAVPGIAGGWLLIWIDDRRWSRR